MDEEYEPLEEPIQIESDRGTMDDPYVIEDFHRSEYTDFFTGDGDIQLLHTITLGDVVVSVLLSTVIILLFVHIIRR